LPFGTFKLEYSGMDEVRLESCGGNGNRDTAINARITLSLRLT